MKQAQVLANINPLPCCVCGRKPSIGKGHHPDARWEWVHGCSVGHPFGDRILKEACWFDSWELAVRNWNMFNRLTRELFIEPALMNLTGLMTIFGEGGVPVVVRYDTIRDSNPFTVIVGGELVGDGWDPCQMIKTWLDQLGGEDMVGWRIKFAN